MTLSRSHDDVAVPPGADAVVVRYGEIGTKSRAVRTRMAGRLVENVAALLDDRGVEHTVAHESARIVVRVDEADVATATRAAASAFGVESASAARTVAPEVDAVAAAMADLGRAFYDGGSFAVDAQRGGAGHDFGSEDLAREAGSAIWEAVADDFDPEVDLDDPDHTFYVDCRPQEAFVFLEKRRGPGGLPLGTQEPLVALISGGIDSPVAAYEVMTRGSPVIPLYLDLGDFGGPDHRARAEEVTRTLAAYAPNFDLCLRVAPAGDAVADLVAGMDRGRMLSFRRFMFRLAEHVAEREGAVGVVTGESLGQKSSQTAANLAVTSAATTLPIHRPLLAANKTDIVDRAKGIGTYTDSTIPAGCSQFVPPQPMTRGDRSVLERLEPDDLFERAAAVAERVEVGSEKAASPE
ncbi:MAG: tRNA sulfurtransferase [Haloferacaceae archaeon]